MAEKKTTVVKKEELKYKLQLKVQNHSIGMKPFVLNTLGNICEAMIAELKGISKDNLKEKMMIILEGCCAPCGPEEKVKVQVGNETIQLKEWVQEMINKTIRGFLSSLQDVPKGKELDEAQVLIDLQKK